MAITKLLQRYTFGDMHLNTIFRDYRIKVNEIIDSLLGGDDGVLSLYDTDKSDILTLKWDEDDSNPRDFKFKVNKGDRTLDLSGNLTVESASILNQDYTTDASVTFGGITINGDSILDGAVTINESGEDKNFRVEGLDYTYLFFTDASTNRIGINENVPKALFHIRHGTCADYAGVYGDVALLLEGTTSVTLQLQGSANAAANIVFADDDYNPCAGRIQYDFNTDEMNFGIGTNILVYFKTTGAVFTQDEMEIDSTGYAAFIANAHNADAYFSLEEDEALKWTMGFDYSDSRKFQISEGIPGTNVRFEIEPNGLINCYLNLAIRNTLGIRFYDNGNYVGFRAPALTADQTWVLPSADGSANEVLGTDGSGNLIWRTHDELAGFVANEHISWVDGDGCSTNFATTGTLGAGNATLGTISSTGNVKVTTGHIATAGTYGIRGYHVGALGDTDTEFIGMWGSTGGASIAVDKTGTGSYRDLLFLTGGSESVKIDTSGTVVLSNVPAAGTDTDKFLVLDGSNNVDYRTGVNVLSDIGGISKTTGAWSKSIGSGGDYSDWSDMIGAMPDLIAHAVTVTIKTGTTLTEVCDIKNRHAITSAGVITIQGEKYYPTVSAIPLADSATATTLRDAELATAALGNDYFNGCWIHIVHGTGTDNGYVAITDYVDATGDVVVAAWPGTQPDNTSNYVIVGALVDGESARSFCFHFGNDTVTVNIRGIGVLDAIHGVRADKCFCINFKYSCVYNCSRVGIWGTYISCFICERSGIVGNNTDNNADYGGCLCVASPYSVVSACGISDNNQRGILMQNGGFAYISANFGDNNGTWGTYVRYSAQGRFTSSECSGSSGNHSDEGTAGANSDDQAAAYT